MYAIKKSLCATREWRVLYDEHRQFIRNYIHIDFKIYTECFMNFRRNKFNFKCLYNNNNYMLFNCILYTGHLNIYAYIQFKL